MYSLRKGCVIHTIHSISSPPHLHVICEHVEVAERGGAVAAGEVRPLHVGDLPLVLLGHGAGDDVLIPGPDKEIFLQILHFATQDRVIMKL